MYFHRIVRDRAATVWRLCSVAVDVVVDRWRCRLDVEGGVRLLGQFYFKKDNIIFYFFYFSQIVKRTVR